MADAGVTSLRDQAEEFFAVLDTTPAAGAPIAAYPVDLLITTPKERFVVEFRDGKPGAVSPAAAEASPGYWTLELRGEHDVFEGIFAGALTMGEAMYAGILVAPEEKSKHNLTSALGQTIRLAQEAHRRARDPRARASAQAPYPTSKDQTCD